MLFLLLFVSYYLLFEFDTGQASVCFAFFLPLISSNMEGRKTEIFLPSYVKRFLIILILLNFQYLTTSLGLIRVTFELYLDVSHLA